MEQLCGRSKFYWLQFTTLAPVSPDSHVSKMFLHMRESFCKSASQGKFVFNTQILSMESALHLF